jgi:transposase
LSRQVDLQETTGVNNSIDISVGATLLLGLDGLAVERVEVAEGGVRVVHAVTADEGARGCPVCGVIATGVKRRAVTRPRDLCAGGEPYRLVWHKRHWVCRGRPCPKQTFAEQIPQVEAGMRTTLRLREATGCAVADGGRTVAQAARDHRVSWPVAMREVRCHAAEVLPGRPEPAAAIGIDEIRRGRPVWEQDPHTGKYVLVTGQWHVGFVDLSGSQGLLGQVGGRRSAVVAAWLSAQATGWREGVRHVAIGMCEVLRSAVRKALPHATIVVGHFHLVQLANSKLAGLRRRVT